MGRIMVWRCPSIWLLAHKNIEGIGWFFFFKFSTQVCLGVPSINLLFVLSYPINYINPGYGLSLVDTLWNASSYRQPLEQEGNPMT